MYVLVHPGLEHDPAEKQNEIGVIAYADLPRDDVFVRFDDGAQGLYSADALLMLMSAEQVHQYLSDMAYDVAFTDLKPLVQIDLFLRYGSADKQRTALELARSNKNIQQFSLETLENKLEIHQSRGYE